MSEQAVGGVAMAERGAHRFCYFNRIFNSLLNTAGSMSARFLQAVQVAVHQLYSLNTTLDVTLERCFPCPD